MSKPLILVTGANGQVGKELRQLAAAYPQFQFLFLSREDLPIHHFELVRNFFETSQPAFCINCAAYTAVDKAESEKDLALLVNAESVGVLAAVAKLYNTRFIHISTDYVFDGTATTPYKEDAPVNPVNFYGSTKLKGEEECQQANAAAIIIRTSWVYSAFGNNFVKTMLRLMKERQSLNVVNDQLGSPTYAADLANAILQIVNSGNWQPGIYHYSNTGVISWYQFAVAIKELAGLNCTVNPIPTSAYPTPAKRPAYSVFNKEKIQGTYKLHIPDWKDSLKICLTKLEA
ncbi:MAG: dTDP-4-dehydrorhamnose reductase [Flavihumibacter sp.]|nr:dTDP-4-dehydrorhamnose reductase [Flavihumibacter sp.]